MNSNGKDREQSNSEQVGQDHTCELYECKIIINHSILSTTHIDWDMPRELLVHEKTGQKYHIC